VRKSVRTLLDSSFLGGRRSKKEVARVVLRCRCKARWRKRSVVEEVLDCVEGWKRREKAFEAGAKNILPAALLTRLFTALAGLALLVRDVSLRDERRLACSPKQNPLT
jgi:hypothetical protein